MSKTIDERVVQMQFDNGQFEKNVETSMGTLDRLKKSLNLDGATKGLENVEEAANNVSFDKIASGVEALQDRFSTLGIVGMRVIQNLTDSAMNLISKGFNWITNGIVQGGISRAMNLENANFQLTGLLKNEEAVAAVMKNVQDSVDGTAYSLDAAATVAAQLAASGMKGGDNMYKTLRGIAGVAAMTNATYEEIGNIFTAVAGNGRLMGMQLTQLSYRGMNAAATLAEYLTEIGNGVVVTEAEVREAVSDGAIDFQTFADAMDYAFGEHAKDANKTFQGSLSNVRAALARTGAMFVSDIIKNEGSVVKLFNALRVCINQINKNIKPLAETFTTFVNGTADKLAKFIEGLKVDSSVTKFVHIGQALGGTLVNVFKGLVSVIKPVGKAFKMIFPESLLNSVVRFANHLEFITKDFKVSGPAVTNLRNAFKGLFSVLKLGIDILKAIGEGIKNIFSKLTGVSGDILEITGAIGNWLTATVKAIEENKTFTTVIESLSDGLGNALVSIRDYLKECDLLEGVGNLLSSVFNGILDVISNAGPKIREIFKSIGEGFSSFVNSAELDFAFDGTVVTVLIYNLKKLLIQINKLVRKGNPVAAAGDMLDQLRESLYAWEQEVASNYFLKIGAALLMLAVSLLLISSIDPNKLLGAMGAVVVFLGGLLGMLKLISGMDLTRKSSRAAKIMVKIGIALLLLALALKITASALKTFAKVAEMDSAWEGFGLMAASLVVLIGALAVLSQIKSKMLVGAAAILIISAAMMILALAIGEFALMAKAGTIWDGIGVMTTSLVILMAALFGLSAMSAKILIGAAAIAIISVALLALATAIGEFALMVKMDTVWEGFGLMVESLGALMLALLGLSHMSPKILIGAAAMLIMSAALVVLATAIGQFAVVAAMGTAWEGLGLMAVAIGALTLACLGLGAIAVPVLKGAAVLLIMAAALAAFSLALTLFSTALPGISLGFSLLGEGLKTLWLDISDIITALGESIGSALNDILTGVAAGIEEIIASIGEGIGRGLEGISEGVSAIGDSLSDLSDGLGDLGDGIERFGNGVRTLSGISWTRTALGMGEFALELGAINDNKFDGDTTAITDYIYAISNMVGKVQALSTNMSSAGKSLATSLGNSLTTKTRTYYNSMVSAGKYLVDGFISGINSKTAAAKKAATSLGSATSAALKRSLDERSPSKLTYQFGEYFTEGFVNGIQDNVLNAERTSKNLGERTLSTLRDAMSKVSDESLTDIDEQPVIRPIIDLTDVKTGANKLNGMISDIQPLRPYTSLALATSAGTISANQSGGVTMNFTIYGAEGQDVNQLAEIVSQKMNISLNRRSNTWR